MDLPRIPNPMCQRGRRAVHFIPPAILSRRVMDGFSERRGDNDAAVRIRQSWPPEEWCDVTVLCAVSGGADSVALVRLLAEARLAGGGGRLVVAHFDHALRDDSQYDADFVERLAGELGLECVRERSAGWFAGDGVEEAARRARYDFLRRTAERLGARYVATAHTRDDQVETVLHRVLRGTGLRGLSGIPRARSLGEWATLIRPLLDVPRAALRDYLSELGQTWREDPTNAGDQATRNRLRLEVLPRLAELVHPGVDESLLRLARLAAGAQEVIDHEVARREACVTYEGEGSTNPAVTIDRRALSDASEFLVSELLRGVWRRARWPERDMSLSHWSRLATLVLGTASEPEVSGVAHLPGGVRAAVAGDSLRLWRAAP